MPTAWRRGASGPRCLTALLLHVGGETGTDEMQVVLSPPTPTAPSGSASGGGAEGQGENPKPEENQLLSLIEPAHSLVKDANIFFQTTTRPKTNCFAAHSVCEKGTYTCNWFTSRGALFRYCFALLQRSLCGRVFFISFRKKLTHPLHAAPN